MAFDMHIRMQGFFRSLDNIHGQSTNVLHIHWNGWRRVFRHTHNGILPPTEDELLGPSAFALFGLRLGPVSDLQSQLLCSLASLYFRPSVCNFLCHKIAAFTIRLATARPGPPYPSMIIFVNLNFIEKLYVDYIPRPRVVSQFRQLPAARFLDETLIVGTSTEDSDSEDEEETAEDDDTGVSESAIEMLRRRKFEWRGEAEENCSICLETFSDGEEIIPLRCDHIYHEACIITWLKKSHCCPMCRREV